MAVDIHKLIGVINPKVFCSGSDEDIKKINGVVKDALDKMKADLKADGKEPKAENIARALVKVANDKSLDIKLKESDFMDWLGEKDVDYRDTFSSDGLKNPIEKHKLVYDSFTEPLESIYFWIFDALRGTKTKLIDNFSASPTSGMFGEVGLRATKMQEEAMKILGSVNVVIKSILNLIYDLKEFKIRLEIYKDAKSEDVAKKNAANLALKQIWLDQVDVKKGNSSIKGLALAGANQPNFVTLIDAFMSAETLDVIKKSEAEGGLDLNDRVRRLLLQRYEEYEKWRAMSEEELNKRYSIEKNYLKSQLASLKLYVRWLKPYLKAARDIEMSDQKTDGSLINAFNTSIQNLVVMAEGKASFDADFVSGDLPKIFKTLIEEKKLSDYYTITIVEFEVRGVPERIQQGGYAFRGRVEITFTSYALTKTELDLFKKAMDEDDVGDANRLIEEATGESIETIEKDIKEFIEEKKEIKDESKKDEDDTNPFSALFSFLTSDKKKEEKKDKRIEFPEKFKYPDYEKVLRNKTLIEARRGCGKIYDLYKKAHGMPAFPGP